MIRSVWCSKHGRGPVTDGTDHTGNYNSFLSGTLCLAFWIMLHFCAVLQHDNSSSTCVTAVLYMLLLFYTCYCCFTRVTAVLHVLLLFYTCYCCFTRVTAVLHVLLLFYTCYCHRMKCVSFVNMQVVLSGLDSAVSVKSIPITKPTRCTNFSNLFLE